MALEYLTSQLVVSCYSVALHCYTPLELRDLVKALEKIVENVGRF